MVSRPPEPIPSDIEPDGDDLPAPPDQGDLPAPVPGDPPPPGSSMKPDGDVLDEEAEERAADEGMLHPNEDPEVEGSGPESH